MPRTCWGSSYSGHFGWRIECQSGRAVLEMETQKVSLHYWIANYELVHVCVFASNTEEPTNKKLTNSQMLEYNNANLDQYRAVV